MNRDDIIKMAQEAGIDEPESDWMYWAAMERFAALVAAAERQACAQIAFYAKTYVKAFDAIRARGEK